MRSESPKQEPSDKPELDGRSGRETVLAMGGVELNRTTNANKSTRVTEKRILERLEEQGYLCFLTGRTLVPENSAIDHLIPVSEGGRHEMENIAIVHADVNRAKNTMSLRDFIELCQAVIDWHHKKMEAA